MVSLYTILGVHRGALPLMIRNAYRELARIHHPDKGGSVDVFTSVNEAYTTLSDPEKRRLYDLNWLSPMDMFWTEAEPFYTSEPINNIVTVVVTVEDICRGADVIVDVSRTVVNEHELRICTQCSGTGVYCLIPDMLGGFLPPPLQAHCTYCTAGYVPESISVHVIDERVICTLPVGCPPGMLFSFVGKGDQTPGTASGNLIVRIACVTTGPMHIRHDTMDLAYVLYITPYELYNGFTRSILHPDGRYLYICNTVPIQSGIYVVPDQGIHFVSGNRCGHLYIQIQVVHMVEDPIENCFRPTGILIKLDCTLTRPPTSVVDILQENTTVYGTRMSCSSLTM
jgi:DnaJ family protein A protein 2